MKRIVACLMLCALAGLLACASEEYTGPEPENQAPKVWLSAAPPEGSTGKYTVQLFWGGWDPDGEIAGYEYFVTDNVSGVFDPADTVGADWKPVAGNDSSFTFSADLPAGGTTGQVSEFQRSHTFFVRSIDTEGLRSVEPAHRSFTSRTLSPRVDIQVPRRNGFTPADVPPISTFSWKAYDYVSDMLTSQDPDSVQWAFEPTAEHGGTYDATEAYLRTPESASDWYPFIYYRAPEDSGKSWTTPPQEFGNYVFAMRAKDEAGAVTPVLDNSNLRRVRVSRRTTGPNMTLTNVYMGTVQTTSCNTPPVILDIPAGVPLEFKVSANADSYGGVVVGYRYGWDIADLNDPDQWEVDYTPFVATEATIPARTFFLGTHILTVEVIDNSGFCARIEVKVNIVQFTLEQNVLIVDDYKADEGSQAGFDNALGRGVVPNDAEHDAFWLSMVENLDGFDPLRDVIQTSATGEVPLTTIARYKSVMWSVYSDLSQRTDFPILYSYIIFRTKTPPSGGGGASGKVSPNILALAMAAGSHIMIAGQHPIQLVENRSYTGTARHPLIFLYELEGEQANPPGDLQINNPVGDQSFAYKELCLEVIDYAYQTTQRRRTGVGVRQQYCPVNNWRRVDASTLRTDTMREGLPIDAGFPLIELRPEVTATGKFYAPSAQGIDSEVYNPAYFRKGAACVYVPTQPRPCFQPIYGLGCIDTLEPTYNQPVAFWTSAFADRVADVPGAVGARSVVFGFPPVLFKPDQMRGAFEYIMFEEWQLPRKSTSTAAAR